VSIKVKHKPSIFISHSRSDSKWSERLARKLEATGFPCFTDNDISPGDNWDERIRFALDKSDVCLVVLSNASDPLRPETSKEWSAMLDSAWRRRDLALCSVNLSENAPPPFLRKWDCLNVSKSSTSWDDIVPEVTKLLEEAQAKATEPDKNMGLTGATERFAEIRGAIEASKVGKKDFDAK
jgi:hypothetical protein